MHKADTQHVFGHGGTLMNARYCRLILTSLHSAVVDHFRKQSFHFFVMSSMFRRTVSCFSSNTLPCLDFLFFSFVDSRQYFVGQLSIFFLLV